MRNPNAPDNSSYVGSDGFGSRSRVADAPNNLKDGQMLNQSVLDVEVLVQAQLGYLLPSCLAVKPPMGEQPLYTVLPQRNEQLQSLPLMVWGGDECQFVGPGHLLGDTTILSKKNAPDHNHPSPDKSIKYS